MRIELSVEVVAEGSAIAPLVRATDPGSLGMEREDEFTQARNLANEVIGRSSAEAGCPQHTAGTGAVIDAR